MSESGEPELPPIDEQQLAEKFREVFERYSPAAKKVLYELVVEAMGRGVVEDAEDILKKPEE